MNGLAIAGVFFFCSFFETSNICLYYINYHHLSTQRGWKWLETCVNGRTFLFFFYCANSYLQWNTLWPHERPTTPPPTPLETSQPVLMDSTCCDKHHIYTSTGHHIAMSPSMYHLTTMKGARDISRPGIFFFSLCFTVLILYRYVYVWRQPPRHIASRSINSYQNSFESSFRDASQAMVSFI